MAQYIDKDALVAEIERRIERCAKQREDMLNVQCHTLADDASARMGELRCFQDFLDTLEVKVTDEVKIGETQIYLEDDGGEPPYDGKQWLDLSCTEYEIPKALFKDGDNVEILIRKAQKIE